MIKKELTILKKGCLGFSLFELLVVISIIGILTALAVVSYSNAQKKGRDARRVQDMKLLQTAAEQFYSQNSYIYPSTTSVSDWTSPGGQAILNIFPVDPKNDSNYYYSYRIGTTYCACARVENISNGNAVDRSCTFNIGTTGGYFCVKSQQ
jgi:prepilin-type N-terminal cleavage/methylation domain-containing protein